MAFGGSTTQNFVDGVHYPLLLQKKLQEHYTGKHIEVINIGNNAYATTHSLILLEFDVLEWDPDLIIISHNINDLLSAYFPNFNFDYSNKYSLTDFQPGKKYLAYYTLPNVVFSHSSFYWFLQDKIETTIELYRYRALQREGSYYNRKSYGTVPPEEASLVFRRNLDSFVTLARSHGIKVVLGTQPLERSQEYWDRHMRFKAYNDIAVYPQHEEFLAHHDFYNNIIRSIGRDKSVMVVDNASIFSGNKSFFEDFVHYNKAGLERLAQNYYDEFVRGDLAR